MPKSELQQILEILTKLTEAVKKMDSKLDQIEDHLAGLAGGR
jgi:hypothetical protein